MNVTLRELAFMTGVLCFGALIGAWILYRHVEWAVRRITREYVPPKPVYVPDRREEFTEADREELSRKVSFRDADTLTVFGEMNAVAEPEPAQITDAARRAAWVNERGTVIHPRAETRRRDEKGRFTAREPDAVIAPGSPPPFRPDLPVHDVEPAVATRWDASLTVDLDDDPSVAASKLALKYFGTDYSRRELAGSRS